MFGYMKSKTVSGLSVVIATHNEAVSLGATLEAIQSIADEIIVMDGESTDDTVRIAKQYGARVFSVPNQKMFHINKQLGIEKAAYTWILQLDADEIVTPALREEIKQVVAGKHSEIQLEHYKSFRAHIANIAARDGVTYTQAAPIRGYFIARKNFFLGRYLMHSGVYPDGVIRLFQNGFGYLPCKSVHEQVVVDGGVSWLQEPMIHMSDPTFSRYMARANRYTSLTAEEFARQKVGISLATFIYYMLFKPTSLFLLLFFRHKGFMDGFSGFVWSLMSGLHYPMAYMKYVELMHARMQKNT